MRIDVREPLARRFGLWPADVFRPVQKLAVQIGERDLVVIDDPDRADTGSRQVERGRRSESAGPETEETRCFQLPLSFRADLRQYDVARVSALLLRAQDRQFFALQPFTSSHLIPTIRRFANRFKDFGNSR